MRTPGNIIVGELSPKVSGSQADSAKEIHDHSEAREGQEYFWPLLEWSVHIAAEKRHLEGKPNPDGHQNEEGIGPFLNCQRKSTSAGERESIEGVTEKLLR